MDQPWVDEGDKTRCRKHDVTFPRGRACPTCSSAPTGPVEAAADPNEAKHVARVMATADRLHAQASSAAEVVETVLLSVRSLNTDLDNARKGERVEHIANALASSVRAWAMAADVERKALVAAADYDKVLARVAKVANQRRERTAMRKARGH